MPNHTYSPALQEKPYDYRTPVILDAVAADMTLADVDTQYVMAPAEIAALLKRWLKYPIFDPEYADGVEPWAGEIAAWHDVQLDLKAQQLGCSRRMIRILEELVRCFVAGRAPDGVLARRMLLEY